MAYCQTRTICVFESVPRDRHDQENFLKFDVFLKKFGKVDLSHWRHFVIEDQIGCFLIIDIQISQRRLLCLGEVDSVSEGKLTHN